MKICKWYNICPIKYYIEAGFLDNKWAENYCLKSNKECRRYQSEEKSIFHPDNMLPDGSIDHKLK
ncbi:MAG: uracil-DNA glycosylase [Candidatus Goldiibacteriota bacterium]